jgi:hypothetical protein
MRFNYTEVKTILYWSKLKLGFKSRIKTLPASNSITPQSKEMDVGGRTTNKPSIPGHHFINRNGIWPGFGLIRRAKPD